MHDGAAVSGRWRGPPASGGAAVAALTSIAALPLEMAAMPLKLADFQLTATCRLLDALAPDARPGPASR
ncbi:MAG: hypothetical protein JOY71_14760 [Acetobacteraceae bacterium]|nr:hypothetical protein [Acetobacteraceae bacterium]